MFPPSSGSSPSAASLPPLPDLTGPSAGGSAGSKDSPMASIVAGLAPIKSDVDLITAACKRIQATGVIPGSEQVLGQITALAVSLLPMAAQSVLQPGGQQSPVGGVTPMGQAGLPQLGV